MTKILDKNFFTGNALTVAENIIGKYLVRDIDGQEIALMINEVEAYDGHHDKACHASKGKTPRTEVMFEGGGIFYVYFIYGIHWMLNIVVGAKDYPAALLIRGAGDINGPARLTKFLNINKELNQKKATRESGLWFEDRGEIIDIAKIKRVPRIGVAYAGEEWAQKPYRFIL